MAKKLKKPCGTCPFTDRCEPGETGGSPVWVYVAQTLAPFWVPCHECIDYEDENWREQYGTPQCMGHAIMRSKMGVTPHLPEGLLRVDHTLHEGSRVFDDLAHFCAYHEQISIEEAREKYTTPEAINAAIFAQMHGRHAKTRPSSEFAEMIEQEGSRDG